MKNKKKYLIIIPIVAFILGFLIVKSFNRSYAAGDDYYYIRRNMLSKYFIKNNIANTASGTILVKTGSKSSESAGTAAAVYCAEQGVNNSGDGHAKKTLNSVSTNLVSNTAKNKLNRIMPYMYPYISLRELRSVSGIEDLDVQEALTAAQASIWNAMKGVTTFRYGSTGTISSSQSRYKNFGSINWNDCPNAYRITNRGTKSTILNGEESSWTNSDWGCATKSDASTRINTLIDWYGNLAGGDDSLLTDGYKASLVNYVENVTGNFDLEVMIQSLGSASNYKISFVDSNNQSLTVFDENGNTISATTQVTVNPEGNKFIIHDLPSNTSYVNAIITSATLAKTVYYYQGGGQDWIGVDTRPGEAKQTLAIRNSIAGKIVISKVTGASKQADVIYGVAESRCDNGCLAGAYFTLYAADKQTVIEEFVTETTAKEISDLYQGTYYLKEVQAPYGYDINPDYIKIEITDDVKFVTVVANNNRTQVCFLKVDSVTKKAVSGSKFRIMDSEGTVYVPASNTEDEFVKPGTTPQCLVGELDNGWYYFIEDTPPANYIKNNTIYKFKVGDVTGEDDVAPLEILDGDEDYKIEELNLVNGVFTVENVPGVAVSKSDMATGLCLAGATLTVTDKNGKVVDTWVSSCVDGKDTHKVTLKAGTYTLTEVPEGTPAGYATAESITFTINSQGKVDKPLDMKDAPITACFLKTSKDAVEGLEGAVFEIYKKGETELYQTFISDVEKVCIPYMPIGTYILKETKAPEGYKISQEEIEIEVKNVGGEQVFEIPNELITPKTSMDYSETIIIIASVFMMFGLGLVGYYAYKKQN